MTSRYFVLIASVYLLFALTLSDLAQQVRAAREDGMEAEELMEESEQYRVQVMNVTMYAPLSLDAIEGHDYMGDPGRTASGGQAVPGKTAAAGPNIPFGTRIYIEGLGWRTINDRGGAIGPNEIDLVVSTKEEAITFGRQRRLVIFTRQEEEEK